MNLERKANIQSITSLRQEALGSYGFAVWSKPPITKVLVILGSAAWEPASEFYSDPSLSLSRLFFASHFQALHLLAQALHPETPAGSYAGNLSLQMAHQLLPTPYLSSTTVHSALLLILSVLCLLSPLHHPSPWQ